MLAQINKWMFYINLTAILLLAGFIFDEYPLERDGGGEIIFIIAAIVLVFFLTKGLFAHKAEHLKLSVIDVLLERVATPVASVALITRYTSLTIDTVLASPMIWILMLIMADPGNIVRSYFSNLDTIKSGHFLRPITSEHPESDWDYLQSYITVAFCYLVLWWR